MEPEEIDKLFNERLGRMAPTPPADLWNRLQDRMEAEMPQKNEEKHRFGWLYYSVAAAITLLLAIGGVLKLQQPQTITKQTIASADTNKNADQSAQTIIPEVTTEQSIAAVTPAETIAEPTIPETPAMVAETEKPVVKKQSASKPKVKKEERWVKVEQSAAMLAQQKTKPATPKAEPENAATMQTPVSFASNSSAEPVEIIIKRTVNHEEMAMASAAEPEETSSFQRKQKMAKNIFKQVKNLSNGEKINLEEVGLSADKIALETRIGKQRISKVINL